jgi:hypothetical protein
MLQDFLKAQPSVPELSKLAIPSPTSMKKDHSINNGGMVELMHHTSSNIVR